MFFAAATPPANSLELSVQLILPGSETEPDGEEVENANGDDAARQPTPNARTPNLCRVFRPPMDERRRGKRLRVRGSARLSFQYFQYFST